MARSPESISRAKSVENRSAFRRALLAWYDQNWRDLPWRRSRDPYAIWLSEIMLQQTTVRAVEPRWEQFLRRWPRVEDLAAADPGEVLHEWTGLGYYARARNLHRAARRVMEDFGGRIPERFELLLALPGMGNYTAAAVASIAFGEPVAAVDANIERVIARLITLEDNVKSAKGKRLLREEAEELLDRKRPGDFNQAMMELGALVCQPKKPACTVCPVKRSCRAYAEGTPTAYPKRQPKPAMESVREAAVVVWRDGRFLVLRRPARGSFAGMWELPRVVCRTNEESRDAARRAARDLAGLAVEARTPILRLNHTVMRRRITLTGFFAQETKKKGLWVTKHEEGRWVFPEEWLELPKSTTQAKVARLLAGNEPKEPDGKKPESQEPDLFENGK